MFFYAGYLRSAMIYTVVDHVEFPSETENKNLCLYYLVGGCWWLQTFFIFHFIYGMSSFPTDALIFFKMVIAPPTSYFAGDHDGQKLLAMAPPVLSRPILGQFIIPGPSLQLQQVLKIT